MLQQNGEEEGGDETRGGEIKGIAKEKWGKGRAVGCLTGKEVINR